MYSGDLGSIPLLKGLSAPLGVILQLQAEKSPQTLPDVTPKQSKIALIMKSSLCVVSKKLPFLKNKSQNVTCLLAVVLVSKGGNFCSLKGMNYLQSREMLHRINFKSVKSWCGRNKGKNPFSFKVKENDLLPRSR